MKNSIKSLQSKYDKINNIEKLPILQEVFGNKSNQISLIELILHYQYQGKQFYMSYKNIAKILRTSTNSIKTIVNRLSKEEYLITKNISNYNKETGVGGSYTIMLVNEEKISKEIDDKMAKVTPKEVKVESNINISNEKDIAREEVIQDKEFNITKEIISIVNNRVSKEVKRQTKVNSPIKKDNQTDVPKINSVDRVPSIFDEDYVPINPNQLRRNLNPHRI